MSEDRIRTQYDDIAKQIEREDTLIDKRTMWLVLFEGLIFSAVSALLGRSTEILISERYCTRPGLALGVLIVVTFLLFLGGAIAWNMHTGVVMAEIQLWTLKWQFEKLRLETQATHPDYTGLLIRPFYEDDLLVTHAKAGNVTAPKRKNNGFSEYLALALTLVCFVLGLGAFVYGVLTYSNRSTVCADKATVTVAEVPPRGIPPTDPARLVTISGPTVTFCGVPSAAPKTSNSKGHVTHPHPDTSVLCPPPDGGCP
jgi:hypothetical protein